MWRKIEDRLEWFKCLMILTTPITPWTLRIIKYEKPNKTKKEIHYNQNHKKRNENENV